MDSEDILSFVYAITFLLCPILQKTKYLKYDLMFGLEGVKSHFKLHMFALFFNLINYITCMII